MGEIDLTDSASLSVADDWAADHLDQAMAHALQQVSDAVFVCDEHSLEVLHANRGASELHGYSQAELLNGMTPLDLAPSLAADELGELLGALADAPNESARLRTQALHKSGETIPVEVCVNWPAPVDAGGVRPVVAVVRSIADQVAAESAERASQARFRATFGEAPVAMAIVEVHLPDDRRIVDVNEPFAALFGYTVDQIIGMSPGDLLHPLDNPADTSMLVALASGGDIDYAHVVRGVRADGSLRWLQRHIGALDAAGSQNLLVAHVLDITAQVEAAAERARQEALDLALSAIRLAMLQGASRADGLRSICKSARDILDASTAMIVTPPTPGSRELLVEASVGIGQQAKDNMSFGVDTGEVGEVFRTGKTKHVATAIQPATPEQNRTVFDEHQVGPVILAPLPVGQETVGVLVVSRLAGAAEFSDGDHEPIGGFAAGAVAAIELANSRANAQLVEKLEDRERIAREMHDGVIGRLFGTGMALQSLAAHSDDAAAKRRLLDAVEEIDSAVKEIRATIFGRR